MTLYRPSRRTKCALSALMFLSTLVFPPGSRSIAARHLESVTRLAGLTSEQTVAHSSSAQLTNLVSSSPKHPTQLPRVPPVGRIKIKKNETHAAKALSNLDKFGPAVSAVFSMSDFRVDCFVRANWPIFFEYELGADSTAEVTVNTTTDGKPSSFLITLPSTNGVRRGVKEYLPGTFGQKPQAGSITFRAFKNGPEPKESADVFLYGFAVGEAVRSLPIVKIETGPPKIRTQLKEKISYSFQSIVDFNKVAAEFRLVVRGAGNSSHQQVIYSKVQDGVRRGQKVEDVWNGKNFKGNVSVGPHFFWVRAWRDLEKGADYAIAAEKFVTVVDKE